ncbi:MAG TPA: sulfotransferase [Actinomycetota bacterium]|nr:sulfotransferase [Actinomycetota bacterium]
MSDRGGAHGRLPTFLVVGAQKSGTTSLVHYLGAHPDVFALPDEVHFFDRNFERGTDWYREHFRAAGRERHVGESTPEYMYAQEAPRRIADTLGDVRLLAILRDPVDRAYSAYWHNRTRGHEQLAFEEALDAEQCRLASGDESVAMRFAYVDRGRYAAQLRRVREALPEAPLSVTLFERLRDERVETVRSLYRFLGVDDAVVPPQIAEVKNRFVEFRSQRLRRPIRRLPGPLRRIAGRLNIRYRTYPSLSAELRARVAERFRDDNVELASWLGLDLSPWT